MIRHIGINYDTPKNESISQQNEMDNMKNP